MKLKSTILNPLARLIHRRVKRDAANAVADQAKLRKRLVQIALHTQFGQDHAFKEIKDSPSFKSRIPIKDYEGNKAYFDRIAKGESNVNWPGIPKYLAKTSGTTSGVKYIPITKDSVSNHFITARNASFNHAFLGKNLSVFDHKLIFLSGSPTLTKTSGILTGRLSGIVNHEVPSWLQKSQMPSYETNCISEWEDKLDKIVEETILEDMSLISGIPPWVQMYYEKLLDKTGKSSIKEVFPNFNMFVYGGVNFEPYRNSLESLTGKIIPSLETYPASEGFLAFQDQWTNEGLLLNTNSGIYFEFVAPAEINSQNPIRLGLEDIELDKDYAVVLHSNAGLWGYSIGDTVRFVNKDPYRVVVTGRIKHFISAFGEHVIGKEVEQAVVEVSQKFDIPISEFTVAPQVNPTNSDLPYHEWFIEFSSNPKHLPEMAKSLDESIQKQNIYYKDLREGKVLQEAQITTLPSGSFRKYMESIGKLGGQNKVPRLSNDRKIADALIN